MQKLFEGFLDHFERKYFKCSFKRCIKSRVSNGKCKVYFISWTKLANLKYFLDLTSVGFMANGVLTT